MILRTIYFSVTGSTMSKTTLAIFLPLLLILLSCNKQKSGSSDDLAVKSKIIGTKDKNSGNRSYSSTHSPLDEQTEIKKINKKIFGLKNKEEVKPLINDLIALSEKTEHKNHHVIQLYALLAKPLLNFEGIVWRLRGIIEKSGSLHLSAINRIRKFYYRTYTDAPHIKPLADFFIEPNLKESMFEEINEVQDFLLDKKNNARSVMADLEASLAKMKEIIQKIPAGYSFDLDMHLITGLDEAINFGMISEKKEKRKVIRANLYNVVSAFERTIGSIKALAIYNMDAFPKLANESFKEMAKNAIKTRYSFRTLPRAFTTDDLVDILVKRRTTEADGTVSTVYHSNFVDFLTVRPRFRPGSKAQALLDQAKNHFYQAALVEQKAINGILELAKQNVNGRDYLINPYNFENIKEIAIRSNNEKIELYKHAMENRAYPITSEVTGEQWKVNINAFFTKHDDLKAFLPYEFGGETTRTGLMYFKNSSKKGSYLSSEDGKEIRHSKSGDKVWAWDFEFGKPRTWPDVTFANFIEEATHKNIFKVLGALRRIPSTRGFIHLLPVP